SQVAKTSTKVFDTCIISDSGGFEQVHVVYHLHREEQILLCSSLIIMLFLPKLSPTPAPK
ncbi:hypothetical protein, partial [Aminicella lysinilytica]|uniref:hypothetical protein n=1 Tax=Aminicella lysinilytica TaxID=433323 RepID=UPI001A9C1C14